MHFAQTWDILHQSSRNGHLAFVCSSCSRFYQRRLTETQWIIHIWCSSGIKNTNGYRRSLTFTKAKEVECELWSACSLRQSRLLQPYRNRILAQKISTTEFLAVSFSLSWSLSSKHPHARPFAAVWRSFDRRNWNDGFTVLSRVLTIFSSMSAKLALSADFTRKWKLSQ